MKKETVETTTLDLNQKSLNVLIVGGGNVAEEKLTFLLKSSPDAHVTMVSPMFREGTITLAKKGCVTLIEDVYKPQYLDGRHMVVATTDIPEVNVQVWKDCRAQAKLVNVADLRQFFEHVIPENVDDLVKNLNEYRKTIKGDFEEKVEKLNEFTKGLIEK